MNSKTLIVTLFILSFRFASASARCTATVKEGSSGDCVKVVQKAVGTNDDGIFGPATKRAVIAYQTKNGLAADGIVGSKTWAKIYGDSAADCDCRYDQTGTTCSGGPTKGATNLANYLKRKFGGRTEIYNCRSVRGGNKLSLHAEGRAVDLFVDKATGDNAFNHAISIACSSGIQEVIWYRQIWTSSRGKHAYTGVNPHTDHVHVGLNRCGAANFNL